MAEIEKFEGFSRQTQDFLWQIKFNNERSWFLAHKDEYTQYVLKPMQTLTAQVWKMMERRFALSTQPHCSRIYRDARRLHGRGPYKESMWFSLRRDAEDWAETPTFYFEIRPERVEYGMGCFRMRPQSLENFRKRADARPEELRELIRQFNAQQVFTLGGEDYKRKKGERDALTDPWYNKKSLNFYRTLDWGREVYGKNLPQKLVKHFELLVPLYRYLLEIT